METIESSKLIRDIISVNMQAKGHREDQADLLMRINIDEGTENFLLSLLHLPLNHNNPDNDSHITHELFTEPIYLNLIPYLKTIFTEENANLISRAFFARKDYSEYHNEVYSEYIRIAKNELTEIDGKYLILLLNLMDHAVGYFTNQRFSTHDTDVSLD